MQSKISKIALSEAKTQVGQKENPLNSNWGHPVQDYLLSVGINFPASWCMSFLYWCFNHAASTLQVENPLFKTGGVLSQLHNRTINIAKVKSISDIQEGDIFIMNLGGGLGHTGIIESIDINNGVLHTIEGNSNDTGGREGVEVVRKQRKYPQSSIVAILRF